MKHGSNGVGGAWIRAVVALLIAAGTAVAVHAQQNQITFFLAATTVTGEPIADLKGEDIAVAEDGKPAAIVKMVPVGWPVKVTVLLDNGTDTGQLLSQYRSGLKTFLAAMRTHGRIVALVIVGLLLAGAVAFWLLRRKGRDA